MRREKNGHLGTGWTPWALTLESITCIGKSVWGLTFNRRHRDVGRFPRISNISVVGNSLHKCVHLDEKGITAKLSWETRFHTPPLLCGQYTILTQQKDRFPTPCNPAACSLAGKTKKCWVYGDVSPYHSLEPYFFSWRQRAQAPGAQVVILGETLHKFLRFLRVRVSSPLKM